jgi:eukaryotic-like serine/threonine-protein kinase
MAESPKRPASEMPTQFGTTAAVSSSSDNLGTKSASLSPADEPQTIAGIQPRSLAPGEVEQTLAGLESGPQLPSDAAKRAVPVSGDRPSGDGVELELGTVLASRYEIVAVLGTGGMGSVYKARDCELDRLVALKVIRPELARNSAIVDRFKQELRLSHQVTHRNVVRMYDLSEAAGMRFVTMELVNGRDLRTILEERAKLPPDEAVDIFQQICFALEAAHSVGILHRDLKPQNVMREEAGRVVVMDFGLARTIEGNGMTQSGALVGTMEYMSPEQALGKELDQRSDIFALGLIGYEMLTGNMPFHAESAIASLLKRTRERASAVTRIDAAIPGALSDLISKCLETDVEARYKSVSEVLHDLQTWRGKAAAKSLRFNANVPSQGMSGRWLIAIGGGVLAIALAAAVPMTIHHFSGPRTAASAVATPSISLAVMPFYNASGDPSMDWLGASLAEMLGTDIGGSAQVRMVSPDRMQQVLKDLHLSANSQADGATLHRVAEFTNAQTIIFGEYFRAGSLIRITTTVLNAANDARSVVTTDVPSDNQLLASVDKLASQLRQKLTADPKLLKDLQEHADRPQTASVDALRAYEHGLELEKTGDSTQAQQEFQTATTADPGFALAWSKLADTYSEQGHDDLAQDASRKAVDLSENLPSRQRYLIEADNARISNNPQKAIDAYQQLAAANPSDMDVQFMLARLYEQAEDYDTAKKKLAMVLAADPKNVDVLLASGRVANKSGDPKTGLDFLSRALPLATELDNQAQKASILQATGIAYTALDRPDDALRNYQESLAIKKQIGDKRGEAASLNQMADILDRQGKTADALTAYNQGLALRRELGDQAGIGSSLIDIGSFYHDHAQPDKALLDYTEALNIERQLGDQDAQAMCLHNIGAIKMDQGAYQDSLTYLEQAYELRQKLNVSDDVADSLHDLAEVNTKLGQFDTALNDYLKAIDIYRSTNNQRGVAIESNGMARIFSAQARFGAALNSMKDALGILQQSKEVTSLAVEVSGGWGDLLAQVGRGQEGQASLEQALHIAQQIGNDWATALATNWVGDSAFYQGDYAGARQQYDHALTIASKTMDKQMVLLSKVNRARADLALGHAAQVIPQFRAFAQDADALGLKALSVDCAVYLAQAEIAARNADAARQQLGQTLARAENLGLRLPQARIESMQASLLAAQGKGSEAAIHYRQVAKILDTISREDGSAKITTRADLKQIYSDAQKAIQNNQ